MDSIVPALKQVAERHLSAVCMAIENSREAVFNAHVAKDAGDPLAEAEWQKTAKQWFDAAEQAARDHDALVKAIKTLPGLPAR